VGAEAALTGSTCLNRAQVVMSPEAEWPTCRDRRSDAFGDLLLALMVRPAGAYRGTDRPGASGGLLVGEDAPVRASGGRARAFR
jgi:hypothetical protein